VAPAQQARRVSTVLEPLAEFERLIGRAASAEELAGFALSAAAAGRELVVGGLVADDNGRVFAQRRSEQRKFFPGCWDIVGGHAEPGEGVLEALAREIQEETGWILTKVEQVVQVIDWRAHGEAKREIDLIVKVAGDLSRPRLEAGRHTEGCWITASQTAMLGERRDSDDVYIKELFERAFTILVGAGDRLGYKAR